jgi:hypothetical protein
MARLQFVNQNSLEIIRKFTIQHRKLSNVCYAFLSYMLPKFASEVKIALINSGIQRTQDQLLDKNLASKKKSFIPDVWFEKWFLKNNTFDLIFFGIHSPSESSIARYNEEVYSNGKVLFIPTNLDDLETLYLNSSNENLYIPKSASSLLSKFPALPKLISLGNSPDHINTINSLLEFGFMSKKHQWSLQLHDVSIIWLLELTFGYEYVKAQMNEIYFSVRDPHGEPSELSHSDKAVLGVFGISILARLFGPPATIIVHNERARSLVMRDLDHAKINCPIVIAQLPTLEKGKELRSRPARNRELKSSLEVRIGTFGAVDNHKNIPETYELIKAMRGKGHLITWVVAGRGARRYLAEVGIGDLWVEIHDQLSDSQFLTLMSTLDFQVLLRLNSNGESSGVAIQTQYLGIPLIVSPDIVNLFDSNRTFFVRAKDFCDGVPTQPLTNDLNLFLLKDFDTAPAGFVIPDDEMTYFALLQALVNK